MKIKPIIICNAFSLNNVTSLENSDLVDKLESYFAEAVDNGDVTTVWSSGEIYQDTIVHMQDPSGPNGEEFAVDLPGGSMLQIVKMLYKTMGLELEAFLLEHHNGNVVTAKWFVYQKALLNFELRLKELEDLTTGLKSLGYSNPINHRAYDAAFGPLAILVLGDKEHLPKIKEFAGRRRVVDVSEVDTDSDLMTNTIRHSIHMMDAYSNLNKMIRRSTHMKSIHVPKPDGIIYFIPLETENGIKIPVSLNKPDPKHCIPTISSYLIHTVFVDTSWDLIDTHEERQISDVYS